MVRLCAYTWPGNIRELQNVIERAVVLTSGSILFVDDGALPKESARPATPPTFPTLPQAQSPQTTPPAASEPGSLEDVEREHIIAVLKQTNWRVEGRNGAARILNLQPSTLRSRMQKLGIVRPG